MALLRRYSNRTDLLIRLREACEMVAGWTCEQADPYMAVPARRVQVWRVRDRLTDDDLQTLSAHFLAGTSKRELAERYGISFGAVKDLLRRHGVRRTP